MANPDIFKKENRLSRTIAKGLCYAFLIFLTLTCLIWFYILIINSTHNHAFILSRFSFLPGNSLLTNIKNLFDDKNIPMLQGLGNSFLVSSGTALLTTYFSAMTAFGIHAYNFKLRKITFGFIMLVMMVPTQVTALGFLQLVEKMNLLDTFYPLIIPAIASPIVFFYMRQYMTATLPLEIVEAARVDGSNEFRTFNTIVLPIVRPAMAVQAIFTFVGSWNNYFIPQLIISSKEMKTIPLIIAELRSADYMKFDMAKVYMMISVAIVPLIIVFLVLSQYIIKNVTLGSVKA